MTDTTVPVSVPHNTLSPYNTGVLVPQKAPLCATAAGGCTAVARQGGAGWWLERALSVPRGTRPLILHVSTAQVQHDCCRLQEGATTLPQGRSRDQAQQFTLRFGRTATAVALVTVRVHPNSVTAVVCGGSWRCYMDMLP
jgi:hypothetical protein